MPRNVEDLRGIYCVLDNLLYHKFAFEVNKNIVSVN